MGFMLYLWVALKISWIGTDLIKRLYQNIMAYMAKISLKGMKFYAYHGVLETETIFPT